MIRRINSQPEQIQFAFPTYIPQTDSALKQFYIRNSLVVVACVTLAFVFGATSPSFWPTFIVGIPLAAVFLYFIPWVRSWASIDIVRAATSKALAAANGLDYNVSLSKPKHETYQPALRGLGMFERDTQVISGKQGGYAWRTYLHVFRRPFANQIQRDAIRVYEVQLPKVYPHVMLITRRNGTQHMTDFFRHYDDNQRMQLDGNFDDCFIAYTHRRTNTDARTLLGPNVLQTLLKTNEQFSVEFIGDRLFLYGSDPNVTRENFDEGFRVLSALLTHVKRTDRTMKFVLPRKGAYPYLRSRVGYGTATFGGKYFNQSIFVIAWYVLISTIKILAHSGDSHTERLVRVGLVVVSALTMIAVLLVFRRKYTNQLQ